MNEARRCPECSSEIPAGSPAGLCPKCLYQAGLPSEAPAERRLDPTAPSPPAHSFLPPSPEQLAPLFPVLENFELLGKGAMGAVYKARQKGLNRVVAIKILPPEIGRDASFAQRFSREAQALARLSHSNIVAVHDIGLSGGLYYFIMEYVDGVNLRQAIRSGAMTPQQALAIVPQICDALQYAHDEGVVHRDIKPENILIDKKGRVKIADFGLAKLLGHDGPEHSLTGTYQVMGTLRYMAPEQMEGSREVDHRADIYSLGVVFYELLTGELPIGRFAPPSKKVQIDVRLDEVVLRALEKEPEQRFQHASEVKTEVEAIRLSPSQFSTAPPTKSPDLESLERFMKVMSFWSKPQPGYGMWVGLPTLAFLFLWPVVPIVVRLVSGDDPDLLWMMWPLGPFVIFVTMTFYWIYIRPTVGVPASAGLPSAPLKPLAKVEEPAADSLKPWELMWRRAPWIVQQTVHVLLALVYLFGILCVISFQGSKEGTGDAVKVVTRFGQPTPWMETLSHPLGFSWTINIFSWPWLIAIVGLCALAFSRHLEKIVYGKAHSMWWHYAMWSVMLAMMLFIGGTNHYLGGKRPPKVSPPRVVPEPKPARDDQVRDGLGRPSYEGRLYSNVHSVIVSRSLM